MTFTITAPSEDIRSFEGISFKGGVATVDDLDQETHVLLITEGFAVWANEE